MNNFDQPDNSVDLLCQLKIGLRRSEQIASIQDAMLMMWEQVLLVILYARSRYTTEQRENVSHFHARISLIRLAARQNNKELLAYVTRWLDEGKGLVTVAEELRNLQKLQPKMERCIQTFIREAEQKQIVFSSSAVPPLYSHYALFVALEQPVSLFQQLLSVGDAVLMFDNLLYQYLDRRVFTPQFCLTGDGQYPVQTQAATLESLLQRFSTMSDGQDGEEVVRAVEQHLAEVMEKLFSRFSCTEDGDNHRGEFAQQQSNGIAKMCSLSHISAEKIALTLDRKQLESFLLMGQSDEIMLALSNCLKEHLSLRIKTASRRKPAGRTAMVGKWYRGVATELLRGRSQIPALVAAIIDFDIRHAGYGIHGLHNAINWPFDGMVANPDAALMTTRIIAHCLHKNGSLWDFPQNKFKILPVAMYLPDAAAETYPLPDALMQDWVSEDGKKEKERIKRPRKRLNTLLHEVEIYIRKQQGQAMENRYPLSAGFPPPLWATCLRQKV